MNLHKITRTIESEIDLWVGYTRALEEALKTAASQYGEPTMEQRNAWLELLGAGKEHE